jgi:putative endonuclease
MPATDAEADRGDSFGGADKAAPVSLSQLGEAVALEHFERLGFDLVSRNQHMGVGEIDLIVFDGRTLVFVEVKARRVSAAMSESSWGQGFGFPSQGQMRRQRKAARAWLAHVRDRPWAPELRFDVVRLFVDRNDRLLKLDHIEGV